MQGRIEQLHTYPIKGLSPHPLDAVELHPGEGFPGDRLFGFAKANGGFDPQNPRPLPKTSFVVLMQHAKLAGLKTDFDAATGLLTIEADGRALTFRLFDDAQRHEAEDYLSALLDLSREERPNFVAGAPHRFTDVSVVSETMMNAVSLINLDSVEDFGAQIGEPVDPLRFRANIYLRGWPAMAELDMVGRRIQIGSVLLKVLKRTQRCAATEVNPQTAERDVRVPFLLRKNYGHLDMGIYAEVIEGGVVEPGNRIIALKRTDRDSLADIF